MKDEIKSVLATMAVTLPAGLVWLFYGKDILRWLLTYGTTISWSALALVAVAAVVLVWRAVRKPRPKVYGTIPAEMIRAIMK